MKPIQIVTFILFLLVSLPGFFLSWHMLRYRIDLEEGQGPWSGDCFFKGFNPLMASHYSDEGKARLKWLKRVFAV